MLYMLKYLLFKRPINSFHQVLQSGITVYHFNWIMVNIFKLTTLLYNIFALRWLYTPLLDDTQKSKSESMYFRYWLI